MSCQDGKHVQLLLKRRPTRIRDLDSGTKCTVGVLSVFRREALSPLPLQVIAIASTDTTSPSTIFFPFFIWRHLFQSFVSVSSLFICPGFGCFLSDSEDTKNFIIHILGLSGESRVGTQHSLNIISRKEQVVLDFIVASENGARVRVAMYN